MQPKSFNETIHGDEWKIVLLDPDKFSKVYGETTAAITLTDEKQIIFSTETINLIVVLHEIFHAYASYLCIDSAHVDSTQAEEIFAELFGSQGPAMYKQGKDILAKLRKKAKPKNEPNKQ